MNDKQISQKLGYFLVTVTVSGLQFLLLPLFANLLGVKEFGLYSFFFAVLAWITFSATLGAPTKIRKLLADQTQFTVEKIAPVLDMVALLSCLAIGVLLGFGAYWKLDLISFLALLAYFFSYISNQIVVAAQLGMGRMLASAIQNAAFVLIPLALTLIFGVAEWEGRFLLSFVMLVPIFYICRQSITSYKCLSISMKDGAAQVGESLRIAANSFYDKLISQADKIMVGAVYGIEALGLYALGAQISNVLHMAMKSFVVFAEKSVFSRDQAATRSVAWLSVFGLILGLLVFLLVKNLFNFLFDPEFSGVLDILLLQILIVWLRVVQGLFFTVYYVADGGWRYSIVQYISLFLVLLIGFLRGMDLWEFCLFMFVAIFIGLAVNLGITLLNTRWGGR